MDPLKVATQVSLAQYMYKNIHLLGFENANRTLNVAIRELMDNTLDAANLSGVLPKVELKIELFKPGIYKLSFKDYGPGIDGARVADICGRLLYGNKFTDNVPLRGAQGMGLTALILYGQKITGQPTTIVTKTADMAHPVKIILGIDITKNRPLVHKKEVLIENQEYSMGQTGFKVELLLKGNYMKTGLTAIKNILLGYHYLNPNLQLSFKGINEALQIPRLSTDLNPVGKSCNLVLHHMELGDFLNLFKANGDKGIYECLSTCEVEPSKLKQVLWACKIPLDLKVKFLADSASEKIQLNAIKILKQQKPGITQFNLLGPLINRTVTKNGTIEFDKAFHTYSKPVYYNKGILQAQISAFYGKNLEDDGKISLYRVANRVPLNYQSSACAITKTLIEYNWKRLGLTHIPNELPKGNLLMFVHISSTKIPFLTESKDAVANVEIIKLLIKDCLDQIAIRLRTYIKKEDLHKSLLIKKKIISKVLPVLLKVLKSSLKEAQPLLSEISQDQLEAKILETVLLKKKDQKLKIFNGSLTIKPIQLVLITQNKEKANLYLELMPGAYKILENIHNFKVTNLSPIEYVVCKENK